MDKVLIIGTGGLAREFARFFSKQVEIVGFVSFSRDEFDQFELPGIFIDDEDGLTPEIAGTNKCLIAVGNPAAKEKINDKYKRKGFEFPNFVHKSSVVATEPTGDINGVVISPNCTVGSNVAFSDHVYLNFMVGVGHDCVFGKYVQINPGVQIGGASTIGTKVLIGSGARIRQGLSVGDGATVGLGAVAMRNVRNEITVIGNPAKRLKMPSY